MDDLNTRRSSVSPPNPSALFRYAQTEAREALDELIRLNVHFVYAAARRQVKDAHLAEDVTQAVFMVLARRAKTIKRDSALPAWLFKTVRYAAANAIKMEQRRRRHEQIAASRRPERIMPLSPSSADEMMPFLDEAISKLSHADRDAVLMRYLQGREMTEVATTLGVSEIAARKRVARAIERLRLMFIKRGMSIESAALVTTLTTASTEAAPATVIASVSGAVSGAAPSAAVGIAQNIHWMLTLAKAKLITFMAMAAIVLVAGTTVVVHRSNLQTTIGAVAAGPISISPATQPDRNSTFEASCVDADGKPIEGAEVYLIQTLSMSRNEQDVLNSSLGPITTDVHGIARFPTVPMKATDRGLMRTVYARLPGKLVGFDSLQWSQGETPLPATSLALTLVKSVTVHGRVNMPAGFKPESATVNTSAIRLHTFPERWLWLESQSPPNGSFSTSIYDVPVKSDGTFEISDVPETGMTYLFAKARGLAESQIMVDGQHATPILEMRAQSVIRGRVTNPAGKPVANAAVVATPLGNELVIQHRFTGKTDSDGQYTIERLPGIYIGLLISTPELVLPVQTLRLGTGETVVKDLALETGTIVTGRATDPQGKPLAGVDIDAESPAGISVGVASAQTDATGRYTFRLPSGKAQISISGPPEGFTYPKKKDAEKIITIPSNALTFSGPNWRLPRAKPLLPDATATLQGRVIDEKRNGVANLSLEDSRVEDQGRGPLPISDPGASMTDSTGHYSFKVQARIPHTVSPSDPNFDRPLTRTVTPAPDETITFEDLIVHPRPVVGSISAIVTDPQGHPLESVLANWSDPHGPRSDSQGKITVPIRSTTQPVQLVLVKSGYKYRNWNDIPPGTQNLRLTLYPSPATGPDFKARTKIPNPKTLLNRIAPPLHVDWVLTGAGQPAGPGRPDGKITVVAFAWHDETAKAFATQLEKLCIDNDAAPVIIYNPVSTDPGVRALFSDQVPLANIGIDQYNGDANPNDPLGQTELAYGVGDKPAIYVISSDGTLIHTQNGLNGLAAHLGN